MRDRIEQLRVQARALEPDSAQRAAWRERVIDYGDAFLERLPDLPVFCAAGDEGRGIVDSPIGEQGEPVERLLALLDEHVVTPGVNLGKAGHMAFIPPSSLYTATLGDYLATLTNRYAGAYFAAPGAVRLERLLLRWLASFTGYPTTAAGDLTSGGSVANLIGIVTAREAYGLRARDYERAVVYLSDQTHHSVTKALRIGGMGDCLLRRIPLDAHFHMRAEAVEAAIQEDRQAGRIPWLLVAAAGTTDTGAVDPLDALADVAQRHNLWLHVDGAYGAMFALCAPGREVLSGIERSDSLVLDPHKGLFMPCGSGAVLVKNSAAMVQAHHHDAHYMQDADVLASADEISPSELSPELTRPFRGLRLWLSLKLLGVAPFRAALEEKMILARYFHEQIQHVEGFQVGPFPDLSIVTFRYAPRRGNADDFNKQLVYALQQDGRVFLSSTVLNGEFTIRLAVLSAPTHVETIDLAIDLLRQKAREIAVDQVGRVA